MWRHNLLRSAKAHTQLQQQCHPQPKAVMLLQAGLAVAGKGHPVSAFQYLQTGAWVQPIGKLAALYLACLALLVCLARTLPPLEELQAKAGIAGQSANLFAPGTEGCRTSVVNPAPPYCSLHCHTTIRAACPSSAERCVHRLARRAWHQASPQSAIAGAVSFRWGLAKATRQAGSHFCLHIGDRQSDYWHL